MSRSSRCIPCAAVVLRTVPPNVGPPVLLIRLTMPPGVPEPNTAALPPRTASTRSTVSSSRAIASGKAKIRFDGSKTGKSILLQTHVAEGALLGDRQAAHGDVRARLAGVAHHLEARHALEHLGGAARRAARGSAAR